MADFLTTFYKLSKQDKAKADETLRSNVGKSKDNKFDFFDTFASLDNPGLTKELSGLYDQKEKQKRQVIDQGLNAGLAWEDISKQTGIPLQDVQSYSEKSRPDYGIKKAPTPVERVQQAAGTVKNVAGGIVDSVGGAAARAGNMLAETPLNPGPKPTQMVEQTAQDYYDRAIKAGVKKDVAENLKNKILEKGYKDVLGSANIGLNDSAATIGRKAVSDIGSTVANVLPVGAGVKAAGGAAIAKNIAEGALAGAGGNVLSVAGQDNVTAKDLVQGAKQGAIFGAALPVIGGTVGGVLSKGKTLSKAGGQRPLNDLMQKYEVARNTGDVATMKQIEAQVPDKAMLGASGGATVDPVTKKIIASPDNTVTNMPVSKLTSYEGAPDRARVDYYKERILAGKDTKPLKVLPDSTGALGIEDGKHRFQAYKELGIDTVPVELPGTTTQLNRLSSIDEQLVKATNPQKAAALATERDTIVQNLPKPEQKLASAATDVTRTTLRANTEVPTLAKKTEQRAIVKGLTTGFEDLPTDVRVNFASQRVAANNILKTNPDEALQIALGKKAAPQGVEAAHFYRAIEDKAIKDGDSLTLQMLAEQSGLPQQAREAGRAIGAYGYKDPNSPVDAIREINNLRQAAEKRGVKIPSNVVTTEETKNIIDLAKTAEQKKNTWLDNGGKIDDPSRLEYGRAQVAFKNTINDLKLEASKQTLKEKGVRGVIKDVAGNTKSLQSSMDNSALFRQGWKTLMTNPGKWAKNSLKTWQDIAKTFGGKNTLDELKADIVSRPNAELYQKAKLAVGIDEEAFPTSLPEKLPVAGKLYKASEAAYTGFLQRQRVDIFDKYMDIAKKTGVDLNDKQLQDIGKLVNSLTGRGHLGKLEPAADTLNSIFFSPRMLKSHIDVLTAHQFQQGVTPFVRKEAAKNLLKIISGTAAVLATANAVKPGSVEWDPRSSNFGKIKIGNTRFDVSGGMGSVATLASRLAAWSKKSSTTGDVKSLTGGGFGQGDAADLVIDFFENKLSPAAGVARDIMRGEDFNGNKPTIGNIAKGLAMPLVIQNFTQAKQPNSADPLAALIADGLGISANSYSSSPNWKVDSSKELKTFKDKVGAQKFDEAYSKFNKEYSDWYAKTEQNPRFKKLSNEDKQLVRTNKAKDLRTEVLKSYNFSYETEKKPRGRLNGF